MVPCNTRAIRLGGAAGDPLFGVPPQAPSNNREMDSALALGGRRSIKTLNNQQVVSGIGRRDVREESGGDGGHGGGHRAIVWGGNWKDEKIQIHLGLWWRPIDSGTHNNQATTGSCDRGEDGEEVQQGGRCKGSVLPLILEGAKLKRGWEI